MTKTLNIRDEEILVLLLCRLQFSEEQLKKIRILISGIIDWEYFRVLTNLHGVSALIGYNIEKNRLLKGIPGEITAFLKNARLISLSHNVYFTEVIGEVLELLNKEKIKTVLLKGLALENSVYGNSGLRQMTDVDILVDMNECIKASDILIKNGFTSLPIKSVLHKLIIIEIGKHLPTLNRKGISVEIHHKLFTDVNSGLTRMLFDSSYEILLNGESTYIPQPQIFFLYLVRHLYHHEMNNESQLRLYTDLVVLLENYYDEIINYDLLVRATEAGMAEILARRLEPLRDLWGISFPGWMNDYIDKWYNPDAIDEFVFFLKSPKNNPQKDKSGSYRSTILEIPGIHRKLLFLFGDLFPSIGFMKKRYNCSNCLKAMCYYPHRLGKLLWLLKP